MRTFYIYRLINPNTEKVFYIGITENPQSRMLAHQNTLAFVSGLPESKLLRKSHREWYIFQNNIIPRFEIIETLQCETKNKATAIERFWITAYRNRGVELVNTYPAVRKPKVKKHQRVIPLLSEKERAKILIERLEEVYGVKLKKTA